LNINNFEIPNVNFFLKKKEKEKEKKETDFNLFEGKAPLAYHTSSTREMVASNRILYNPVRRSHLSVITTYSTFSTY
jgi:hypothetical protein